MPESMLCARRLTAAATRTPLRFRLAIPERGRLDLSTNYFATKSEE
jgi:hypothetical protein